MEETKTILQTSHRLRYALIIEGFLVGGCAGIISIIYRQLLSYAEQWVQWLSAMMRQSLTWVVLGFALLLLIGFGISLLLRHEPLIGGSGIPQIEAEVGGQLEENWLRVLWSKMAAGVLAALGGLSLGREGPSIQLGGMCGNRVRTAVSPREDRAALSDHLRRCRWLIGSFQRAACRNHVCAGGIASQLFHVGHRFGDDRFCDRRFSFTVCVRACACISF